MPDVELASLLDGCGDLIKWWAWWSGFFEEPSESSRGLIGLVSCGEISSGGRTRVLERERWRDPEGGVEREVSRCRFSNPESLSSGSRKERRGAMGILAIALR